LRSFGFVLFKTIFIYGGVGFEPVDPGVSKRGDTNCACLRRNDHNSKAVTQAFVVVSTQAWVLIIVLKHFIAHDVLYSPALFKHKIFHLVLDFEQLFGSLFLPDI
jgi:hypothetical protein